MTQPQAFNHPHTAGPGSTVADQTAPSVFDYEKWITEVQSARAKRFTAISQRVRGILETGGHVIEQWTSASGKHSRVWTLNGGRFMQPYDSSAEYIAEHVTRRHFGFRFALEMELKYSTRYFVDGYEVATLDDDIRTAYLVTSDTDPRGEAQIVCTTCAVKVDPADRSDALTVEQLAATAKEEKRERITCDRCSRLIFFVDTP